MECLRRMYLNSRRLSRGLNNRMRGQEVTNYRTGTLNETYNVPTQLVQEVQVKSSGFEATYGGATDGVVSVVTRGGGNDFHGEFGMQFETPKFNGKQRPLL